MGMISKTRPGSGRNGSRMRLVAASFLLAVPLAATGQAFDPNFGDGGTSDFYRWGGAIERAGVMLREEPLGDGFYADNASLARRILFSSTDGISGTRLVASSGMLYLPKGKMPKGGWPLIVWAHGTTGIADVCAPSWRKPVPRDGAFADAWLKQGFAVVAPDYQGLGTPGVHPYLQQKPEGYSTLDSARAALAAYPGKISNRVIITGQSQGSGAALSATYYAKTYAPKLHLLGTIATGLAWRATPMPDMAFDIDGSDSARYLIMRMMAGGLKPGSPPPARLLTAKGTKLAEAAARSCSRDLVPVMQQNGVTGENAVNVPRDKMAAMLLPPAVPAGRPSVPVLVGTGLADAVILPNLQYAAVRRMCRQGYRLTWHSYDGVGHSATSVFALRDSIPFAKSLLAGHPPSSNCRSLKAPGALQPMAKGIAFNE
jgi:dienelactone hydrolase